MNNRNVLDARATVRFILEKAIADTCAETGLRPGDGVETLLNEMMKGLSDPVYSLSIQTMLDDVSAQKDGNR